MKMLSVGHAQERLLNLCRPLPVERLPLSEAAGRWLTEDLVARRDQPARDLSAMDGYAIAHASLPGPWPLAGTSAAGGPLPPPLPAGATMRIFTGAPLPAGGDTVIMQEDVIVREDGVWLNVEPDMQRGRHVRARGSDFAAGHVIAAAGTRIGPAHAALAALAGHGELPVARRPRIGLISTGSELVPPGQTVGEGQLPSSNAVMLAALMACLPCEVRDLGIAPDDRQAIEALLVRARHDCDIVVTTGGASVGDHDLVQPALVAAGGEVDFWKIAMRPGKPLMCGTLGDAVFVGLPGNPVSAYVTAFLFLLPLIRRMGGAAHPLPESFTAVSAATLPSQGARAQYLRGRLVKGEVTPVYHQDSAATHALSLANCLIVRDANAPACAAGEDVPVLLLP